MAWVIEQVRDRSSVEVQTRGREWDFYIRYAPDSWAVRMGESEEPIYNDKTLQELEAAYQDYCAGPVLHVEKHRWEATKDSQ